MPPYTGFVGESYPAASVWERSVTKNWILEKNESETARSPYTLVPTEGLTLATSVSPAPIKALFEQNGRVFFVAAAGFYELTYDSGTGTYTATSRGTLAVDGNPATICANGPSGGQLFITAGDVGYCFVLATNTLTTVVASGAAMGASIDGRFHVLDSSTGIVSFSALLDGTSWPGANV